MLEEATQEPVGVMSFLEDDYVPAAAPDIIMILKRNGSLEPRKDGKVSRVLLNAAEGLDVSPERVAETAHLQFYDGIPSHEIHAALIKAAADLISEEEPDYQYMAARLQMYDIRKNAYGGFAPPSLYNHTQKHVLAGVYDKGLMADYDVFDYNILEEYIDHDRDDMFSYAATQQLLTKYLVQNRVTGKIYESPQVLYMLAGMALFSAYPRTERIEHIKRFYDATSLFKLSLPTPIMAGVRTPTRQFSSCTLIDCDDSLDSINGTSSSVVNYAARRAGIGINGGRIRGEGQPIRQGEAKHTGVQGFWRRWQYDMGSCSQGGVRKGSANVNYPIWHAEFESNIVLKNNRGTEANRIRHVDYTVQINKLFYQRLVQGGNITLFSPEEVPGLYEAFYEDQELFEKLYVEAEANPNIRKKTLPAVEVFTQLCAERAGTGRIYIMHVDHANKYGAFNPVYAPIYMTNLCVEVLLPTKPVSDTDPDVGEIALCTLLAFNVGAVDDLEEYEWLADIAVRSLDALLDYQDYPVAAAYRSTMDRRPLGVGITNYAYALAKRGLRYSDGSANNFTHRLMEKIQYSLIKASNNLAKEKGACPKFNETTYAQGLMPVDNYKTEVDELHSEPLHENWDLLREDVMTYGMRNSTLTALMPCETSSQITNSTNGIEPPRGYLSIKGTKDRAVRQIVPGYKECKDDYELLWNIGSNTGYIHCTAIMQKFVDQSISANTNYDPASYENGRTPIQAMLKDMMTAYRYGVKTLYYHNTRKNANDESMDSAALPALAEPEVEVEEGCDGGGCSV